MARRLAIAALSAVALTCTTAAAATAATITVDKTADDLLNGPSSDCALREAIQAANTNASSDDCTAGEGGATVDTIVLPDIPSVADDFVIAASDQEDDDNFEGDFDLSTSGGPVVIDGRGPSLTTIDANDFDRILDISGTGAATLQDLTVTGGQIDATATDSDGGGIRSGASSLTLSNVSVKSNVVTGGVSLRGGGLQITAGNLNVSNSTITGNVLNRTGTADAVVVRGGGIHFQSGTGASIDRSTISGNQVVTASDDDTLQGGGILTNDASLNFSITDSTISGNSVTGASASANLGGGISWDESGNGELELENVTLSGNSVTTGLARGGGVWANSGTVSMAFTTFGPNTATEGAGIFVNSPTTTVQVRGSVFDTGSEDCGGLATPTSLNHNVERSPGTCGFSQTGDAVVANPMMLSLANNGGPTQTQLPGQLSTAVDRVPQANCVGTDGATPLTADQRGAPRPFDLFGNDAVPNCDSGAAEVVNCGMQIARIIGTPGNDTITGTSGPDGIIGLGGADDIDPSGGDDEVCAGEGDDIIDGKAADGTSDDYRGEGGSDTLDLTGFLDPATVNLATGLSTGPFGTTGSDQLSSIENATGGLDPDTLIGDAGPNRLDGFLDNDPMISGGGGSDTLLGNVGDDGLFSRDGAADVVDCGLGSGDTAQTDQLSLDSVTGCESVDALAEPVVPPPVVTPPVIVPPTAAPTEDPACATLRAKLKKAKSKKKKRKIRRRLRQLGC